MAISKKFLTLKKPEPLGILPEFVIQNNAISQSCYDYSATARKLIAMAMGLLPPDLSELTARFTFTDFCKSLGITKSGNLYDLIKKSMKECTESSINFETGKVDKKGERIFKSYPWFSLAEVNEGTEIVTMSFNPFLVEYIKTLKNMFAKIPLEYFGKLSSKYAIRYFEIALSYKGFEGKKGNKKNQWYFEYSIDELKTKFLIKDDEYERTSNFKTWVIEKPLNELNKADIGLEIKTEYERTGRDLVSTKFNVTDTSKKTKHKTKADTPLKAHEAFEELKDTLIKQYPEVYQQYYNEYLELNPPKPFGGEKFVHEAASLYACNKLQEKNT